MGYRNDLDLVFLGDMEKSSSLSNLVKILTMDKDGEKRFTETLTSSEQYKKYYPDHKKYWKLIAEEIQLFGANSVVSFFRGGKGVLYREILLDVAGHLKIKIENKSAEIAKIEEEVILGVLKQSMDKMTPDELKQLAKEANISLSSIAPQMLLASLQTIFSIGGFQSYKFTLIIANQVMRATGLTFAGNAALMRTAAIFTGPIGWIVTGTWTAVDLAGPATRVTIPAVFEIIQLRMKYKLEREKLWDDIQQQMNN